MYYYNEGRANEQIIPGWTGFNHEITDIADDIIHTVTYLPTIPKSPTKLETIQEILIQIKLKSEKLGLTCADAVFDHAIYSKCLEIVMNPINVELQTYINLRMGGFHAICIFTAVIGKRFASAGLRDIIIEANLVGSGAVEQVLKGKSYNRTVKILKIVYEALQRLKLDEFKNWLYENSDIANLTCALESYEFSETCRYRNNENAVQTTAKIDPLFDLWVQYENDLQSDKIGPMSEFWNSFLTMVDIMLDYIKSIRLADWNLHLQSMERMLKWFHAYDHTNYACHFTYCWADQQNLSEKHPMIYKEFINGNFSVQRTKGKFNMLPPDQVIEQTINKEQKGPGGIIGFSTSPGTVQRWVLSSHVLANVSTDE